MSNVSIEITLLAFGPEGENEPGIYWVFGEYTPDSKAVGPFETEEAAIENATKALEEIYAVAVQQMFGDFT